MMMYSSPFHQAKERSEKTHFKKRYSYYGSTLSLSQGEDGVWMKRDRVDSFFFLFFSWHPSNSYHIDASIPVYVTPRCVWPWNVGLTAKERRMKQYEETSTTRRIPVNIFFYFYIQRDLLLVSVSSVYLLYNLWRKGREKWKKTKM